ncbi:MAG: GtrA family protein [Patescibacteria group bacterium]|nr:GtrA family protein [Patescibacteria group bacterium]
MTSGLDRIRKEIPKLTKFVIVGSTTFLLQTFLYYVFSRWLVSYLPRTMTYFLAVVYSLVYNYSLNRAWTFNRHAAAKGSVKRYAVVAVVASVISSILFWIGHDWLHFYDLYVVVGVNLLVPLYTFVAHRQYTFRNVV